MSNKLFVGNLPFGLSDGELEDLFKSFGDVTSAKVITDRRSGRSKGYGFIEMANDNIAQEAVNGLNGADVKGRQINVSFAREQTERREFSGGDRNYGGGGYGSNGDYNDRGSFKSKRSYNEF